MEEGRGGQCLTWTPLTEEGCWPPDVDLSENQLGAVGAQAVCAALTVTPAVQRAQLAGNDLGAGGTVPCCTPAGPHGPEPLDLSYSQLSDQAGPIWPGPPWGLSS